MRTPFSHTVRIASAALLLAGLACAAGGDLRFTHVVVDAQNPTHPHCKTVGDIDGDRYPDLLAASSTDAQDGLFWYRWPKWEKYRIAAGSFTTDMQVGDVDGDGDLDVVIPRGRHTGDHVWWYENPRPKGDPARDPWTERKIADCGAHDVEVGHLNRDGKLDVVVRRGDTSVLLQKSPTEWVRVAIPTGGRGGLSLGDIDRDGDLDLAQNGYWLETPADPVIGKWLRHEIAAGWPGDVGATLADINADGRLDLVLAPAEEAGRLSWYEAPPDPRTGAWKEHRIAEDVSHIHTFKAADMDGDGDLDLATAEMHQSPRKRVGIYFNDGGKWRQQVVATTGSHNLRVGDIDRDGDLDLAGANWNNNSPTRGAIELWRRER